MLHAHSNHPYSLFFFTKTSPGRTILLVLNESVKLRISGKALFGVISANMIFLKLIAERKTKSLSPTYLFPAS